MLTPPTHLNGIFHYLFPPLFLNPSLISAPKALNYRYNLSIFLNFKGFKNKLHLFSMHMAYKLKYSRFYGSARNHLELGFVLVGWSVSLNTNFKTSKWTFVGAQADQETTVQSQLVYSTYIHVDTTGCTSQSAATSWVWAELLYDWHNTQTRRRNDLFP